VGRPMFSLYEYYYCGVHCIPNNRIQAENAFKMDDLEDAK
jgi:hypothetical protein